MNTIQQPPPVASGDLSDKEGAGPCVDGTNVAVPGAGGGGGAGSGTGTGNGSGTGTTRPGGAAVPIVGANPTASVAPVVDPQTGQVVGGAAAGQIGGEAVATNLAGYRSTSTSRCWHRSRSCCSSSPWSLRRCSRVGSARPCRWRLMRRAVMRFALVAAVLVSSIAPVGFARPHRPRSP